MKQLIHAALLPVLVAGLCAACGDNDEFGTGADAGDGVDADTLVPDGGPTVGTCGLVVGEGVSCGKGCGGPASLSGVPVIFNGPDGSLLGVEFTDVKGEASFDSCVTDTTITFLIQNDSNVFSYAGIQPGDTAYYRGGPEPVPTENPYAFLNVSVPSLAAFNVNDRWRAWMSEGASGTTFGFDSANPPPINVSLDNGSLGNDPSNVDVLALAADENVGEGVVAYSFMKDVAVNTGSPGDAATNAVTLPDWTEGSVANAVILTGVTLGIPVDQVAVGLAAYVDGARFYSEYNSFYNPVVPVVSRVQESGLPDGFGEETEAFAFWEIDRGFAIDDNMERQLRIDHRMPFARTVTVEGAQALPAILTAVATGVGSTVPTLLWITNGPTEGNLGVFRSNFYSYDWYLVTPHVGDGHFTFPEMPMDVLAELDLGSDEYYLPIQPSEASINDFGWLDYSEVVGNPGFDPDFWLDYIGTSRNYLLGTVPQPEPGGERYYRRSRWEWD